MTITETERDAHLRFEGFLKLAIQGLLDYGDHGEDCRCFEQETDAPDRLFPECDCGFTDLILELRNQ